jgi:hypothetical protein
MATASGPDEEVMWGTPVQIEAVSGAPGTAPNVGTYAHLACYKELDVRPLTPSGGTYDLGTGAYTIPSYWDKEPSEPSGNEMLWVSYYTVVDETNKTGTHTITEWSVPQVSFSWLDWDSIFNTPSWIKHSAPNMHDLTITNKALLISDVITSDAGKVTSGLYLSPENMGYYYKDDNHYYWSSYIDNTGNFYLAKPGTNYSLSFNSASGQLKIQGNTYSKAVFAKQFVYVGGDSDGILLWGSTAEEDGYIHGPYIKGISDGHYDTAGIGWLIDKDGRAFFNTVYGRSPNCFLSTEYYLYSDNTQKHASKFGIVGVSNEYNPNSGGSAKAVADCIVSLNTLWEYPDDRKIFGFSATYTDSYNTTTEINPDFEFLGTVKKELKSKKEIYGILYPEGDGWEKAPKTASNHINMSSHSPAYKSNVYVGAEKDAIGFFSAGIAERITGVDTLDKLLNALHAYGLISKT